MSFELNSAKFDAKLTKMVQTFLIIRLILKSSIDELNGSATGAPYFNNYVCRIRFPKCTPIQCCHLKLRPEVISYHHNSSSTM